MFPFEWCYLLKKNLIPNSRKSWEWTQSWLPKRQTLTWLFSIVKTIFLGELLASESAPFPFMTAETDNSENTSVLPNTFFCIYIPFKNIVHLHLCVFKEKTSRKKHVKIACFKHRNFLLCKFYTFCPFILNFVQDFLSFPTSVYIMSDFF